MRLEDKIFQRKRIILNDLIEYGFKHEDKYFYQQDIMDEAFRVEVSVSDKGDVESKVIDKLNDEEYHQVYADNYDNAYVNMVREAYIDLLKDIADKCCKDLYFSSDQANRITKQIYEKWEIIPDFPWVDKANSKSGIFRHKHNDKWFGLIMNVEKGKISETNDKEEVDGINLKIKPEDGETLRSNEGIYHAYHMNKKHWITIILDEEISDETIMRLVVESYNLTQ